MPPKGTNKHARTHSHMYMKVINCRAEFIIFFLASFSSMPRLLCKPATSNIKVFFFLLRLVTVITLFKLSPLKWYSIIYFAHFKLCDAFTTATVTNAHNVDDAAAAAKAAAYSSNAFMCVECGC